MATDTCFQDACAQSVRFYLEHSGENQAIQQGLDSILPAEFKRIGEGKSSLDVLGAGIGEGQLDVYMLTLLQSTFPGVPITSDVIVGSIKTADNFKALVAKTDNFTVPFHWHITTSEDYMKKAKKKGDVKKFDFIHLIQTVCEMEDMSASIQFYQGLLKENGRLMIIADAANSGSDTLWRTFKRDLCNDIVPEYRSSVEVKACLDKLRLKYDEHQIPNEFDISQCFDPQNTVGHDLLNFMTAREDFHKDFRPKTAAAILDHLRTKCSTEKDGKIMFKSNLSCLFV